MSVFIAKRQVIQIVDNLLINVGGWLYGDS